jgi:acyl-CoA thioesterase II
VGDVNELLDVLSLEPIGGTSFVGRNAPIGGGSVVFGGQILAQSIAAGATVDPTKEVKSLHTIFARGASFDAPLELDVDVMAAGRAFASASVTVHQGDRICARSLVLLNAPEPDLIRHQPDAPTVQPPDEAISSGHGPDWWEVRVVDGVDISDPASVGPATLDVWTRFDGAPDEPNTSRALLAFASDGFLIGTAMRPHEGVGQAMAHVSISTTVISHTMSFHEPFSAGEWMLLSQSSPYAGRGRSYGRGDVFSEDGRYVASFVQENMIRDFPTGQAPADGGRSTH